MSISSALCAFPAFAAVLWRQGEITRRSVCACGNIFISLTHADGRRRMLQGGLCWRRSRQSRLHVSRIQTCVSDRWRFAKFTYMASLMFGYYGDSAAYLGKSDFSGVRQTCSLVFSEGLCFLDYILRKCVCTCAWVH